MVNQEELDKIQITNDNKVLIETIQEMNEKYVPREMLNKVQSERDSLAQAFVNGSAMATADSVKTRSLAECKKAFMEPSKSQCEYIEKLCDLRDAAIREEGNDPFVATGHKVKPTSFDYQRAQEIADIYKECLEYAGGDDRIFMTEIYRRIR